MEDLRTVSGKNKTIRKLRYYSIIYKRLLTCKKNIYNRPLLKKKGCINLIYDFEKRFLKPFPIQTFEKETNKQIKKEP